MNENVIAIDATTPAFDATAPAAGAPPVDEAGTTDPTPRLFRRSRTDKMLGGVCGGLAKTLKVDVTLLRVALVAATLLGFGAGVVIYLVCWLAVPEEDGSAAVA